MLAVLIVLIVGLLIILIEYSALKKQNEKRGIFLFSTLLCCGIGLNILNVLHIQTPSLLGWLVIVYRPLYNLLTSWFS